MSGTACIGLGSNLGQPRRLLLAAWQALSEQPGISPLRLSSPYRTKPVAMESPHWFINAAGLLRTELPPESLLDVLLDIERQFGRTRQPGYSGFQDRTLDLDLLLFDGRIVRSSRLILPHPAIQERMFVLMPLAEIVPQVRHPLLNNTIAELLAELRPKTERGDVEQVSWENHE
jgi:2-amino-4-hydroxy-6-hydroxymethyldihydropteridine diphosphokinase